MRITSEEMELRRNRIIRVAYNLINKYGMEGVSLEKIAKVAGVSSKTIFRYFNNKIQLIEETQRIVWKEIVDSIMASNQPAFSEAVNGVEEVRILLKGFENLYKEHSDYILFAYEFKSYYLRIRNKLPNDHYENMLSDIRPLFIGALERGKKDGSIQLSQPVSDVFMLNWGIMRQYVEQMVIHSKLYEGDNPWIDLFPNIMNKIIENIANDSLITQA